MTGITNLTRFRRINGELYITLTVLPGSKCFDLVEEESIINFDGEEYVIKIIEKKTRGQTYIKEVSAVHKFFATLKDDYIYHKYGDWTSMPQALFYPFEDTGFEYTIIDSYNFGLHFWEDGFGDQDKLGAFEDILNTYGAEFKIINNNHIQIAREIGGVTDFQLRYNHNIKGIKVRVEPPTVTYVKGYGKDGLEVEYTSPYADIYRQLKKGKFVDETIEDEDDLLEAIKESIDDEPKVSVSCDFIELKDQNYQGEFPNIGDYLYLIHEPLGYDFKIRIVETKETFDADLKAIKTEIQLGNMKGDMSQIVANLNSKTNKIITPDGTLRKSILPNDIPPVPANVVVTGGFQTIQLEWDFNNDVYGLYEVYGAKDEGFYPSTDTLLWSGKVSGFFHKVQTNETWYYRVRAINAHGNASAYTDEFSATTYKIITDDILFGAITADLIEDLAIEAKKLAKDSITNDKLADGVSQLLK
ncbi:phage tail protein (plasmid) [Bacillus carboniphilus]|uniref:Phage tail protein n=1 Tax=Bacillus carboniphilus TaxID=86663 RepID=A0ABY9JYK9_9BACI|nr:phage tail protein [Bacillus carboniphilus]WLR44486.1 phage tail protein [Bacillus carboniphilus]